jgi:hypothetical protein
MTRVIFKNNNKINQKLELCQRNYMNDISGNYVLI